MAALLVTDVVRSNKYTSKGMIQRYSTTTLCTGKNENICSSFQHKSSELVAVRRGKIPFLQ
jgi:hypothetical protein